MNNLAEKYRKLEGREHVLARPGMYIGSIDRDTCETWVATAESGLEKRKIDYIAGLYKIFDEILVNAVDHYVRLKQTPTKPQVKHIKVTIHQESGEIEVWNDGEGIEVAQHPEYKIYVPELIFGHLLTSSNYDDTEERTIGGQNGIGAKACNIYSEFFEVETVDSAQKLVYKQRFESNMSTIRAPTIQKFTKKPFTSIRFKPDYVKFGLSTLPKDMYDLMTKRVFDICAVTEADVAVHLNGTKLEYKNFEGYANLYLEKKPRVHEKVNDRWEVIASYNEFSGFEQVSFVNGVWTLRGGKHVDYIVNQITKKLIDMISKKKKNITIKPQVVKDNLILFVKSTIVNPSFDSQSKETLTTPQSKFGSKAEISEKFIEKLYKTGIVEKICEISTAVEEKALKKTDGKKRDVLRGVYKLDDANWAGTAKSKDCVLILTEGDSAKSMAIAGLSVVGRDRYGVYPLRGKLLNVKDVNIKRISENEEITTLKKILGLEAGKTYTSLDELRYGKVMVMTDQDVDGSHIKGLIFNMFQSMWPSLIKRNDFITSMLTPIIKVRKQKDTLSFYSMTDYENWKEANNNGKGWSIKYYKGLGTSDNVEAKEYFRELKVVNYVWNESGDSDNSLDLAFNKKRADDRKTWLGNYDRQTILDTAEREVTFEDFINKDLIHFSNYDIERSIPSICDGLKISQRKILYAAFKKGLYDKEIKVAQFCGYVMEQTSYHHGDASLQAAIVGMAQDFVGANNINLLMPNGQFGTRVQGGKDAGAPRYINTLLSSITNKIFMKEDQHILSYLNDDGFDIEPEFYVPIIPMVLVNGAIGIGTGFSTNIPCFNPRDIISVILRILNGEDVSGHELSPWYRGFKGQIYKQGERWMSRGIVMRMSATKIEVRELPIGYWTEDFKIAMEDYYDKCPEFKSYESHYDETHVRFVLNFASTAKVDALMAVEANGATVFENEFKIVSPKMLGTTNMYLFNERGQISKYASAVDIIKAFCNIRLTYYQKRKDFLINALVKDTALIENKIRFIKAVIAGEVIVHEKTKSELINYLEEGEYLTGADDSFDYIIKIPIYNFTKDKVHELEEEFRKKCETLERITAKSIEEMWREELQDLSTTLESYFIVDDNSSHTPCTKPATKRGRKAT
jgi:DNA topoisomerase-2